MNLIKKIWVNNELVSLVKDDTTLDIKRPGQAFFTVQADKPLKGMVSFELGYQADKLIPWFFGYIQESITLDAKQQRLVCREMGGMLQFPLFLNLRHVTIKDILNEVSKKTGLHFVIGKGDYAQKTIPFFYSMGTGLHCLDSIGQSFGIDRYFWQQEASGNIYVGSWTDSHWSQRRLDMDNKWLTEFGAGRRASIPVLPPLRPGVLLQGLGFIESIRLRESTMALTWTKKL